ncbi:hypothetical protein SAMN05192535_0353 [Shouchella rhizosphaerae]|nr:hypothetical protein SAMN05192535_0353 [Shouchella rhizosphaerae]
MDTTINVIVNPMLEDLSNVVLSLTVSKIREMK